MLPVGRVLQTLSDTAKTLFGQAESRHDADQFQPSAPILSEPGFNDSIVIETLITASDAERERMRQFKSFADSDRRASPP
eukprot:2304358-Rhodomonas_salina.1